MIERIQSRKRNIKRYRKRYRKRDRETRRERERERGGKRERERERGSSCVFQYLSSDWQLKNDKMYKIKFTSKYREKLNTR